MPASSIRRHPHLLVLGDNECERRPRCDPVPRETSDPYAARAQLLIVDFRHTPNRDVIEPEHMGGYVSSPAARCRVTESGRRR